MNPDTMVLLPPVLVQQEGNWPLLIVAKSIFTEVGSKTKGARATTLSNIEVETSEAVGWGDDEYELKYDEHNPFDVCAAAYTPIYRTTIDFGYIILI